MEYQNKVRKCLLLLKEQVKQKGLSYQQIADRLDVSLLTIKRQLNGDEISMTKLLALCDAAQINFTDLWKAVEEVKAEHYEFNHEQDRAFFKYPHLFRYFLELQLANQTPEQIQELWDISPSSTHLYLRQLEKIGLLRISEKGNPTILISPPIGFAGDSLNLRKGIQSTLRETSEKIMVGTEEKKQMFFIAKPLILTEELREKMYDELGEVVSRYAELSERYFIESGKPAYQLVVCDYEMQEAEPLPEIINVTGFDV